MAHEQRAARAEPIDRLRDDVRLLGELVGGVLREQGGAVLLAAVEHARTTAIAMRSGGSSSPSLVRWAGAQSTEQLLQLVRAFSVYFHLINLAEQHHRIRMLRERERAPGEPVHESLEAAFAGLARQGVGADEARAMAETLVVHPVLTAHPSEARRRTLLHHLEDVGGLIGQLDEVRGAPRRQAVLLDELRTRITLVWQTAEARVERPSVIDEVQSVVYVLAGVIYDVLPRVCRALEAVAGAGTAVEGILRFGSWVGGDRDGNPAVTADVTRSAARLARAAILRRYREEVQDLGRNLSISARLNGCSRDLIASLERDRQVLGVQAVPQWRDEPYRRKLGLVAERLRRAEVGGTGAYASVDELRADLQLVGDSLEAHGARRVALGPLLDFRRRVETFGFHLAELEVRQHAEQHAEAVGELLSLAGEPGYAAMGESARLAALERRILADEPLAFPGEAVSNATRETLETFRAIADIQALGGPRACQTYVVSMTRAPSDVLATLFLARETGLFEWRGPRRAATCRIDIVPLFETVAELGACGGVLERTLASRAYRAAVRGRGNRQQVMIGYSDSNKDGGYLAATWGTYMAQQHLAEATAGAGVELLVFHGRGGSIGRGGGPMGRTILARPAVAATPRLKATEQGEVISAQYGHPTIAERHFEQVLHALLLSSMPARDHAVPPDWRARMERLADESREAYTAFVRGTPASMELFCAATPFPELATLNLASRPVSRARATQTTPKLDDLRAIPWVFSWTQARINLPGWFGLGSALEKEEQAIERGGLERLQEMYDGWGFFTVALDNVQLSLGTADVPTARRYAETLAPRQAEVFEQIEAEYERTVRAVLRVTRQRELLERSSVLARSIKLRNPYVDALHAAQIALLRRYRALPPDAPADERARLLDAIHHSINGIAAGLQTTG